MSGANSNLKHFKYLQLNNMKTIKLKLISYENFRGNTYELEFADGTTRISGRNGTGKSCIKNALFWLLTGADDKDKQNYDLYDRQKVKYGVYNETNHATCMVSADFEIDGTILTLQRRAEQVWKFDADNARYTHTNDAYTYIVDGLEVSATDYKKTIEDVFCDIQKLKLMLNLHQWENLTWQALRKQFADIIGEVELQGYDDVKSDIDKLGAEDARKRAMNTLNDLAKKQTKVEAEITATKAQLPNLSEIEQAESKVEALKAEREEIEKKREALNGKNEHLVQKRKAEEDAIAEKKKQMFDAQVTHEFNQQEQLRKLEQAVKDAKHTRNYQTQIRDGIRERIKDLQERKQTAEIILQNLRDENKRIKGSVFDDICPNCGSILEGKNRTEALLAFRTKKEAALTVNVTQGKAQVAKVEDLKKQIEQAEAELQAVKVPNIEELEQAVSDYRKSMRPFYASEYESEIARMEAERTEIPVNADVLKMQERMGEINVELERLFLVVGQRVTYDKGMEHIKAKQAEQKQIAQEIATATKRKSQIEQYQREYAGVVRDRVNEHFDKVSVETLEENKSGDLVDTFKLTINGVSSTANRASHTIIGGEVSQVFQKHYGLCLPMFVDDADGINECNLPKHAGQVVVLCATEEDKELKVEYLK